jgi:hypothetical protein
LEKAVSHPSRSAVLSDDSWMKRRDTELKRGGDSELKRQEPPR